ncbi:hypothetical protein ACEUZ9_005381 [Paracoccus litorisediminis]|uniref:hypothetical protein n=1 Tax=Paracoccus litorisediminis TaxID=2006130 RepID=UPI00372F2F78
MFYYDSDVIVMARTNMGPGYLCIGAYDIGRKKNIRLLNDGGGKQLSNFPYYVGDRIIASYMEADIKRITAPHTEDVHLLKHDIYKKHRIEKLAESIKSNLDVIRGDIFSAFSGRLSREIEVDGLNRRLTSFHIPQGRAPNHSVCFWEADRDLSLTFNDYDKQAYIYRNGDGGIAYIPFIGSHNPRLEIKKGEIVRLSLARWWSPDPQNQPKRCQLQLSGCYH